MKRITLQKWLNNHSEHGVPDAEALADFLDIALEPEPEIPVGQRRRSPDGVVEVIRTDKEGLAGYWYAYRTGLVGWRRWYRDDQVWTWEVISDAAPQATVHTV